VRINAGMSKKLLGIVVKIPQGATAVKLATVEDGDIVVNNVSGEIEISNVNGAITRPWNIRVGCRQHRQRQYVVVKFKSDGPQGCRWHLPRINGKVDVTFACGYQGRMSR
jgi:hypothetical protein